MDTGWYAYGPDPLPPVTVDGLTLDAESGSGLVWRVGYRPDPWAWTPWEYATGGRFPGRWDDPAGDFRVVYAGDSLQGCLLEVLAPFRPDPAMNLDGIEEDPADRAEHPTAAPGRVPRDWARARVAGTATLTGRFAAVTRLRSVAALRQRFGQLARELGLPDLDAAVLKLPEPRQLTQRIAHWLYWTPTEQDGEPVDGVRFDSRHGDGVHLWAVFEQPGDPPVSPRLTETVLHPLTTADSELHDAFEVHGLAWAD